MIADTTHRIQGNGKSTALNLALYWRTPRTVITRYLKTLSYSKEKRVRKLWTIFPVLSSTTPL